MTGPTGPDLAGTNNILFFSADDGGRGRELWATFRVEDIKYLPVIMKASSY